jgi:hypothetical protein
MRQKLSLSAFAILMLAISAFAQDSKPPADDADAPWEIAKTEGAALAVPKGWENLDKFTPQVLIFRKNKTADVATEPQMQLVLERVKVDPPLEQAMGVIAARILKEPNTDMVSRPVGENIKLADGTAAMIMAMEVIKDGKQRQLHLKVLAKTDATTGYIVTGTISAPKDSKVATADSADAKWLRELVKSMVIDPEKLDVQKVKDAFAEHDKNK